MLSLQIKALPTNSNKSKHLKILKNKYNILFILLFCAFGLHKLEAQIYSSGEPIYNSFDKKIDIPKIKVEAVFKEYEKGEDINRFKDNHFAQRVNIEVSPDEYGKWIEYPLVNKRIWLLEIEVENASSIHLILNPFQLLPGAKLFFYNEDLSQVHGAITSKNNKDSNILPIAGIEGSNIICELQLPLYQEHWGVFDITSLGAGYPEKVTQQTMTSPEDGYFGRSADCHVNVNCYPTLQRELQKQAVCRIIYQGSKRCTGTLINNLRNDGTPYVLTAAHCNIDESAANEAVFYFNYESPVCSDIDVEPVSVSGASFVAGGFHIPQNYDTLDFTLLKLSEKPPVSYNVYYSGWDATNNDVDSTYMIHHPEGDIKKISIDLDAPETGTFSDFFDPNTHWLVRNYDIGSSEAGSSGSGLIDQNGRLIGTLTGGRDACTELINDYYQKLHHAFDDYKDPTYQLKHWLDPLNSGKLICNGYDPLFGYRVFAEVLSNFASDDKPESVKQEVGYGYISGHNWLENYLFAERFVINGSKYLVGANLNLAAGSSTSPNQYVNFMLWEGGNQPGKIIYEKKVLVSDFEDMFLRNPDSTIAIEFDSTILVDYDFYFGYQIGYNGETFALKTYSTTSSDNSAFTYFNESWQPLIHDGKNVFKHLATEIYAFDVNFQKGASPDTNEWNQIQVYPNPATQKVQVLFVDEVEGPVECILYNLTGQPIAREQWAEPGTNMPFYLYVPTGMYILQVTNENKVIGKTKLLVY